MCVYVQVDLCVCVCVCVCVCLGGDVCAFSVGAVRVLRCSCVCSGGTGRPSAGTAGAGGPGGAEHQQLGRGLPALAARQGRRGLCPSQVRITLFTLPLMFRRNYT